MEYETLRTRVHRMVCCSAYGALGMMLASGCATAPGARYSIWPTKKAESESTMAGTTTSFTGAIASTTKTVKGQFSSMSTAVSSAYGKAKTAIVAPFSSTGGGSDATSVLNNSNSLAPERHVALGQMFESQGNYPKALDSYSKALEIEATNPAALQSMARLYDRQNEKEKSIEFFHKAINVSPANASTYAELGQVYARNGNHSAAKEQLQKAVNLEPKNRQYRSALAGVILDLGSPENALEELRQVETPAMANYQMAYLHFTRNNVPVTQQYLQAALQIDPNLKPARDMMASMGGAQNITQMAQTGKQVGQQAMGLYQQAGAIANNASSQFRTASNGPVQDMGTVGPSSSFPQNASYNR